MLTNNGHFFAKGGGKHSIIRVMNTKKAFNPNKPYSIKYKPQQIEEMANALLDGLPIHTAFDLAFMESACKCQWENNYNKWEVERQTNPELEELNVKCYEIITDANGELKIKVDGDKINQISVLKLIKNAQGICMRVYVKQLQNCPRDTDQWQKWAWLLERTFRKDFGKDNDADAASLKIEAIKVEYVDPRASDDRLKKLENEVKETINGGDDKS